MRTPLTRDYGKLGRQCLPGFQQKKPREEASGAWIYMLYIQDMRGAKENQVAGFPDCIGTSLRSAEHRIQDSETTTETDGAGIYMLYAGQRGIEDGVARIWRSAQNTTCDHVYTIEKLLPTPFCP